MVIDSGRSPAGRATHEPGLASRPGHSVSVPNATLVEREARAMCKANFDKEGCEGEFGSVDDCWWTFADDARRSLTNKT